PIYPSFECAWQEIWGVPFGLDVWTSAGDAGWIQVMGAPRTARSGGFLTNRCAFHLLPIPLYQYAACNQAGALGPIADRTFTLRSNVLGRRFEVPPSVWTPAGDAGGSWGRPQSLSFVDYYRCFTIRSCPPHYFILQLRVQSGGGPWAYS
ncbi:hypothetical protein THAOC_00572, partial [Thalassiosira oceanica]